MFDSIQSFFRNIFGNVAGADIAAIAVYSAIPLLFILVYGLIAILGEMKISAWIQDRLGPMRTGPMGLFQPFADILKLLQKEDTTPLVADKKLYNAAPFMMFAGSYAAFAALPFSAAYIGARINTGIFFILSISSLVAVGIMMAGWGSNSKYSLMGAMRSVAQLISYEIPAGIAILTVVMAASSMDLQTITHLQAGGIQNWFIFGGPKNLAGYGGYANLWLMPFLIVSFLIYLVASLAETNRVPFDIPEAESELVAGFHTEYSGMKFALFFLAEYANMFAVAAIASVLFLGGWQSPFGEFLGGPVLGFLWFVLKGLFFVFLQICIRWTLPRLRVDQLMHVCWKVLIPFSIAAMLGVGIIVVSFGQ
jgi:NADH-quinone oxidoreductase subunit H